MTTDPREALLSAIDDVFTDLLTGAASFNVKTSYDVDGRKTSTNYSLQRPLIAGAAAASLSAIDDAGVALAAGVPTMTPHAESLRRAAVRLDGALHMIANTPISSESKLEGLVASVRDVRTELVEIVRDTLGLDPWADAPLDN